ncbi:MAG: OmpP1/FadL family transporter [Candidatus Saccharicenans sp.]
MKIKLFIVLSVLVLSQLSFASGFLIYEHGAAAMAMAGAFAALANDPTAIFYNPAGLAWVKGTQLSLGGTFIFPAGSLTLPNWPDPTFQKVYQLDQTFFPPHFYLSKSLGERLTAGIGVFAPYGLGTAWPVNYPLRYICTETSMQTLFINPTLSYKLSDNLALGFGVSYITSELSLDLVRLVTIPEVWTGEVPASLKKAKGDSVGFNAGLLYKRDRLGVGIYWRSGFKVDYSGTLKLDKMKVPALIQPYLPDSGEVTTSFRHPNIFGLGISYQASEKFLLALEGQYYTWNVYDRYVIAVNYQGGGTEEETVEENFKNSIILRAGLQYLFRENLAFRAGLIYDQTPQPVESMDPTLPDASRVAFTLGFGYTKDRLKIDVGYQLELFSDRTSPNRDIYPNGLGYGTYHTSAQLVGFTLGYRF